MGTGKKNGKIPKRAAFLFIRTLQIPHSLNIWADSHLIKSALWSDKVVLCVPFFNYSHVIFWSFYFSEPKFIFHDTFTSSPEPISLVLCNWSLLPSIFLYAVSTQRPTVQRLTFKYTRERDLCLWRVLSRKTNSGNGGSKSASAKARRTFWLQHPPWLTRLYSQYSQLHRLYFNLWSTKSDGLYNKPIQFFCILPVEVIPGKKL